MHTASIIDCVLFPRYLACQVPVSSQVETSDTSALLAALAVQQQAHLSNTASPDVSATIVTLATLELRRRSQLSKHCALPSMPGWNPDALVSRQVATNATVQDVVEGADEWRSAAAKYEQKRWAEHSEIGKW